MATNFEEDYLLDEDDAFEEMFRENLREESSNTVVRVQDIVEELAKEPPKPPRKAQYKYHFKYAQGLPGSGKTYILVNDRIPKHVSVSESVIYAGPSIHLLDEVEKNLTHAGIHCQCLHSKKQMADDETVYSLVHRYLNSKESPKILLITHNTLTKLQKEALPIIENCHLYVDEIPECDDFIQHTLPQTYQRLLSHIETEDIVSDTLLRVYVRNKERTQDYLDLPYDDLQEPIKKFLRQVSNPNLDTYLDKETYQSFIKEPSTVKGEEHLREAENSKINSITVLVPEFFAQFKSTTFLGAMFDDSVLYKLWSELYDAEFIEDDDISSRLLFQEYPASHRTVTIHYCINKKWSKTRRDMTKGGIEPFDHAAIALAAGRPFIFPPNQDHKEFPSYLDLIRQGGIPIGMNVAGVNTWKQMNVIYLPPALNRDRIHASMLAGLCKELTSAYLKRARQYTIVFQLLLRSSLRDPNATDPVDIIVPDVYTACYIAKFFKNFNCRYHDIITDEYYTVTQVVELSKAQKQRLARKREAAKLFSQSHRYVVVSSEEAVLDSAGIEVIDSASKYVNTSNLNVIPSIEGLKTGAAPLFDAFSKEGKPAQKAAQNGTVENTDRYSIRDLISLRGDSIHLSLSYYLNKFDNQQGEPISSPVKEYIKALCAFFESTSVSSKEKIPLQCPFIFKNGFRRALQEDGSNNVQQAGFIMLDFDEGAVTPDIFDQLFTIKGKGHGSPSHRDLWYVTHSSFNNDPDRGIHRFRVLVITDRAMSLEEYFAIWDQFSNLLLSEGYANVKVDKKSKKTNDHYSGLDRQTRIPTSLFYLPARNINKPDHASFIRLSHSASKRNIQRYCLKVDEWLKWSGEREDLEDDALETSKSIQTNPYTLDKKTFDVFDELKKEEQEKLQALMESLQSRSEHFSQTEIVNKINEYKAEYAALEDDHNAGFFTLAFKAAQLVKEKDFITHLLTEQADCKRRQNQIPSIIRWLQQHQML